MRSDPDAFADIMDHIQAQLQDGTWRVLGWMKAATTKDDATLCTQRMHIVKMERNGGPPLKYALAPPASPSQGGSPPHGLATAPPSPSPSYLRGSPPRGVATARDRSRLLLRDA